MNPDQRHILLTTCFKFTSSQVNPTWNQTTKDLINLINKEPNKLSTRIAINPNLSELKKEFLGKTCTIKMLFKDHKNLESIPEDEKLIVLKEANNIYTWLLECFHEAERSSVKPYLTQ